MDSKLRLWKVRQLEYCQYTDYEGCIVVATTWQRAKGIALDRYPYWKERGKDNVIVEEIDIIEEKIILAY